MGSKFFACMTIFLLHIALASADEDADSGHIHANVKYCESTTGICRSQEEVRAEAAKVLERRIWADDEWEEWWTVDRKRTYFLNKATQKTQWDDPRKASPAISSGTEGEGSRAPKKKGKSRRAKKHAHDEL